MPAANLTGEAGAAEKPSSKAVAGQVLAKSGGKSVCLEGLKNVHNGGQHTGKGEVKKSSNQPHKATSHPNAASTASKATKAVFNGEASAARKGTDPDVLKVHVQATIRPFSLSHKPFPAWRFKGYALIAICERDCLSLKDKQSL